MARPPRMLAPETTYHVMARGNNRRRLYMDDHDRAGFVGLLDEVIAQREWTHLGYCLMDNHFHLLVRTLRADLPAGMTRLLGLYARRFNARHERVGHLFRDRYKAVVVENDRQLFATLRYIALNPVTAGIAHSPMEWTWSSYRALISGANVSTSVDTGEVLRFFHPNLRRARVLLRGLVEEYPADAPVPGTASRRPSAVALAQLLTADAAIAAAADLGYLQREIAEALGLHRSTVTRRALLHAARPRDARERPEQRRGSRGEMRSDGSEPREPSGAWHREVHGRPRERRASEGRAGTRTDSIGGVNTAPQRVRTALLDLGLDISVIHVEESARTAEQAAAAVNAGVGQIVKSLVFHSAGRAVLALVSGANRLDPARLAAVSGQPVERADAAAVRDATGYAIGGVPPVGLPRPMPVVCDRDLLDHDVVWAAAGTPHHVFPIDPATLVRITGAHVAEIAQR